MADNGSLAGILRRTSFVVADAEKIAKFYQHVFGWERFYDNDTPVDARFPPCAPDAALAKLIILKAKDPDKIGRASCRERVFRAV